MCKIMTESDNGKSREMPYTHIYHILLPCLFIFVYTLDVVFFHFSTFLDEFISLFLRVPLFIISLVLAWYFQHMAHKTLFKDHKPSDTLITTGILGHVRNPMYLGIVLIYIAFLFLNISLLAFGVFIVAFIIYNRMINFEEGELVKLFGQEFLEYKKKVPKWIPKLKKF